MSSHFNRDLFRQQAIDYHFKEPESRGVTSTRPRWTGLMIAALLALAAATLVYIVAADAVVDVLLQRLLR